MNRRAFIHSGLLGLGAVVGGSWYWRPWRPQAQKRVPLVDRVIFLTMSGGPSQIDTFDFKPELFRKDGQRIDGFTSETGQKGGVVQKPMWEFSQYGESGHWVSDLLPYASRYIDDLCFIRSMNCQSNNHGFALNEMNTGTTRSGAAHIGAWIDFALGPNNQGLPRFVVLTDPKGLPRNGKKNWSVGFLPGQHQPVVVKGIEDPLPEFLLPEDVTQEEQIKKLALLRELNDIHMKNVGEVATYLDRQELIEKSFATRESLLQAVDVSEESESTLKLYGVNDVNEPSFALQALRARRLAERGAKFIQLYSGGQSNESSWDNHLDMNNHEMRAIETDQAIYGLIEDLKNQGLFERTLIVWGGEFGRFPVRDERKGSVSGRGHNKLSFTYWLSGGPIKKAYNYGETDELALNITDRPVSFGDLHATILFALGIDHNNLRFQKKGVELGLTNTGHSVLQELFESGDQSFMEMMG